MILPIIYYGNPILRKKADRVENITEEIKALISNMFETMYQSDGIGLAAPQINQSLAIFITCVPKYDENEEKDPEPGIERVFINPKILSYSEEICTALEGCLSIPKVNGYVTRPYKIKVEATDLEGNLFTQEFEGYEARCIMHENDHINGKLYIDRMEDKERKEIEPRLKEIKKKYHS